MLLDEFQYPHLDGILQLCALARCARLQRERIDEVRDIVQH